ncbi:MAG: hypothetical protein ACREPA_10225 [Candidatus Dormibacteraceae bacterium]
MTGASWGAGYMNQIVAAFANWAASSAAIAINSLAHSFGASTEPSFTAIASTYQRMLAIALLLTGAFIACALIERLLGGPAGAGWNVIPRTLIAVFLAATGLALVTYLAHYAALLATAWAPDLSSQGTALIRNTYSFAQPAGGLPLGSVAGLILTAIFTLLLALLVYVELMLRSALILVTTVFIPLVCVMCIWPRLAGAAGHLVEFLLGLLLSKFVIATSIYVGFGLVLEGLVSPAGNASHANAMVVGLATLAVAAFAPLVLIQGLRFGHGATASLARSWSGSAAAAPMAAAGSVDH